MTQSDLLCYLFLATSPV